MHVVTKTYATNVRILQLFNYTQFLPTFAYFYNLKHRN